MLGSTPRGTVDSVAPKVMIEVVSLDVPIPGGYELLTMKIRLKSDLDYLEQLPLEQVRPTFSELGAPTRETPMAENRVKKLRGDIIAVEPDVDSERAEPKKGSRWFVLTETRHRFSVPTRNFEVVER